MPIYSLKCIKCNNIQEELIGLSELKDLDSDNLDLLECKIKCKKCGGSKFKKQVTAHSKTTHNWSAWQRRS